MNAERRRLSAAFFKREPDGSVRLRMRFSPELASLIEEAAGKTPLMVWIYRALETAARRQIDAAKRSQPPLEPPLEEDQ